MILIINILTRIIANLGKQTLLVKVLKSLFGYVTMVDDREEPPRPSEGMRIVALEELPVETIDEGLHGPVGLDSIHALPPVKNAGPAPDAVFHLMFGGIGDIYFSPQAFEAQEVERLAWGIYPFLCRIGLQTVLD